MEESNSEAKGWKGLIKMFLILKREIVLLYLPEMFGQT